MTMNLNQSKFKNLTPQEAILKQYRYGINDVDRYSFNFFRVIFNQIKSPLFILYSIFIFVSFITNNIPEGLVILAILSFSSIINLYQQVKTFQIFKRLKTRRPKMVKVIRGNKLVEIPNVDLVPGDLISLSQNEQVPADCKILEAINLSVEESNISGESFPIVKSAVYKNIKSKNTPSHHMLYSGSFIKSGECLARVTEIGNKTRYGKTYDLKYKEEHLGNFDNFLKDLLQNFLLFDFLFLLIIILLLLIFNPEQINSGFPIMLVSIIISVIPEALPATTALALMNGASKLSKKGLFIQSISKLEDLANIDLIVSDKTGTLTLNEMQVEEIDTPLNSKEFHRLLDLSSRNSKDPFDIAITKYLEKISFKGLENIPNYQENYFDPFIKLSSRDFDDFEISKGAPELILKELDEEKTLNLALKIQNRTKTGERALSLIIKQKKTTKYIGTIFFMDKIKDDAKDTISKLFQKGLDIKIISGDNLNICAFVGKNVGLIESEDEVIEAQNLQFDTPTILKEQLSQYKIIARADPIQKYKIIENLKTFHKVAYLGDGVNDVPSISLADIGIVVENTTPQVKERADIIFATKHLHPLIDGIVESRKIYENIQHYLTHSLTSNLNNFVTISVLLLFLQYLPILPIQILIGNLLIDLVAVKFIYDPVKASSIRKPSTLNYKNIIRFSIVIALVNSLLDFVFFYIFRDLESQHIQTIWFSTAFIVDILIMFTIRSPKAFYKNLPNFRFILNMLLAIIILTSIALIGIPFINIQPISLNLLPILLISPIIYFIFIELVKILLNKFIKTTYYEKN